VTILFGVFLVAHGLVYALYVGHAMRLFELKPGMSWPDASWALSGLIGDSAVRWLVAGVFVLVAAGFALSGVALMAQQPWWEVLATAAAIVSTLLLLLVWDGRLQGLGEQGLYAILINIGIIVCAAILHWPKVVR
jgi:cytochrome bd-type quinol oxidase subunit 2